MVKEVEECPAKTAISVISEPVSSPKIAKIGEIAVFAKITKFKW